MGEQVRTEELKRHRVGHRAVGHTDPPRMHQGLAPSTALPGTVERFSSEHQLSTPLQITA